MLADMATNVRLESVFRTVLCVALLASAAFAQDAKRTGMNGRWLYVEDRTPDRPVDEQQPPMSITFGLRIEKDAVVMIRGSGARQREERYPCDGSTREAAKETSVTQYRGKWEGDTFAYDTEILRLPQKSRIALIRRQFRIVPDGLEVRVQASAPDGPVQVAFYQHPEDIALPTPAKAKVADLAWLSGDWVGTRRTSAIEERWGPVAGGSLFGVSRTLRDGKLRAFEYLRIVERDGGLVYVAQPGGRTATEFVLTSLDAKRAVFDNPRHDFPQRIVYERSDEGALTALIGFVHGGKPRRYEFHAEKKEGKR